MLALHRSEVVHSLRHLPSWFLLTFAAGAVNAFAVLACATFVSHLTGSVTRAGLDIARWTLLAEYALVVLAFIVGAAASALAIDGRYHRGKRPLHATPPLAAAILVAGVAVGGSLGAFGPFGGTPEEPGDFAMLALLSLAMGLQNASVATTTGMVVRTTHLTGPATDLGIGLATYLFAHGDVRRQAGRGALLRSGKIVCFMLGAVVMGPLASQASYPALLLPAMAMVAAIGLSFIRQRPPILQKETP